MKKTRFSEEQSIGILKEVEAGRKVGEVCQSHGISKGTYYRWKANYGGMDVSQMRRLQQLEEENRRLKTLVVDLTLDNTALKDVLTQKW